MWRWGRSKWPALFDGAGRTSLPADWRNARIVKNVGAGGNHHAQPGPESRIFRAMSQVPRACSSSLRRRSRAFVRALPTEQTEWSFCAREDPDRCVCLTRSFLSAPERHFFQNRRGMLPLALLLRSHASCLPRLVRLGRFPRTRDWHRCVFVGRHEQLERKHFRLGRYVGFDGESRQLRYRGNVRSLGNVGHLGYFWNVRYLGNVRYFGQQRWGERQRLGN